MNKFFGLLFSLGMLFAAEGFAESPPRDRVAFKLQGKDSKKCFAVKDAGTDVGTRIVESECAETPEQFFYYKTWMDGAMSFIGVPSNLCIEVKDQSDADATPIQLASCTGEDNQKLSFWPSGEGYFHFKVQGNDKCLDMNEAGEAQLNDCAASKNKDFLFTNYPDVAIPEDPTPAPKYPRVFIDNSEEEVAEVRPFDIDDLSSATFTWVVQENFQTIATLDDTDRFVDLLDLGKYAGKTLNVSVTVGDVTYNSLNQITIPKVTITQAKSNVYKPEPNPGLGLLGHRADLELSYEVRRREYCQKKAVISIKGVYEEKECRNFTFPDFKPGQEETIKLAAIAAFNALTRNVFNEETEAWENDVLACAIKNANEKHGDFNLSTAAEEAEIAYNNENAARIVREQIRRWTDRTGPNLENFKIHFGMNYREKPPTVLGHARVGEVQEDFSSKRPSNGDSSRFEVHLNQRTVSEDFEQPTSVDMILRDEPYTHVTTTEGLAATIAHELIHQMGISHSRNPTGGDHQDDFVYELGSCAEDKIQIVTGWYEVAPVTIEE